MHCKIGLGTAAIGRPQYINIKDKSGDGLTLEEFKSRGLNLINKAYNLGVRYFDTAPGYGMAEELLSNWQKTNKAEEVEIATKWGYKYTANFNPLATIHEVKEHTLDLLNTQWSHSNTLLSGISTLQIHSATLDTGVLENTDILKRLHEIKQEFNIKIGLSTTGYNQCEVIKQAVPLELDGIPLFETFQVTYNILDQSLSDLKYDLIGKRLIIKEALANGRLLPHANYPHYRKLYIKLIDLANNYGTTVDAIALRFCMDSINPFMVLSGASTEQQLLQNLDARNFQLSEEDLNQLKQFGVDAKGYWTERKQLKWN
jgi:aryl-alcohol dehydrogenase-like predicted oxidoreductase